MQSTLHGVPLGVQQLTKGAADHVPVLSIDGDIDLFVLTRMQHSMPLDQIRTHCSPNSPQPFAIVPPPSGAQANWRDATRRVDGNAYFFR